MFVFTVLILSILSLSPIVLAQTAIVADHNTVDLTVIPDVALSLASALRVHLRHASVGGNINDGLNAIQAENSKYDRTHWVFYMRGNPGWQAKVIDLDTFTIAHASEYDVFSMKFCWIDPDANFASYRDTLLHLESRYPSKHFVWWTMPITRDADGSEGLRQDFNESVRTFAVANGKLLFDIADIEAHNAAGVKKTDGSGHELQQDVWSLDGGHLNPAGARRVASAFWWLMARVAGWGGTTKVEQQGEAPLVFNVLQNYPNPFNPSTTIEFTLAEDDRVTLKIFDMLGREVATLLNGELDAGKVHQVKFDASRLSSGMYFYRLEAGENLLIKKMILMK